MYATAPLVLCQQVWCPERDSNSQKLTSRASPYSNSGIRAVFGEAGVFEPPFPQSESNRPRGATPCLQARFPLFGGGGGIRTHEPGTNRTSPLAGACLRPLGHSSGCLVGAAGLEPARAQCHRLPKPVRYQATVYTPFCSFNHRLIYFLLSPQSGL